VKTVDEPILQIDHLSKTYPGVKALDDVSFQVQPGQIHALVGENGAGKSTLIKILAGAEQPDPGAEMHFQGREYRPQTPRDALQANISTIYQVFNLLPDRTTMHNIMLGKEPARRGLLSIRQMRNRASEVLERLDAEYLDPETVVSELTVGEQQIVEIAKALINESIILVMDEPTAALNQTEAEALFQNVQRLRDDGVTIIYVSHRLDEIFRLADAVTVLRDGKHISTNAIEAVTRESLIEDMIGRRLENVFPERVDKRGGPVLHAEGLSAGRLLKDVTFTLRRGEVLAVAGLSGSGKSELGKAIFGDLPLDAGRILIDDQRYVPKPGRAIGRGMIYLPEDRKQDGVLQDLSVKRNLSLSVMRQQVATRLGILRLNRERQIAQEQIDALDIKTPDMEQLVLYLSGGNQQKVALGRCLAANPDILILMEPTQGIDVGVKFELYQFIVQQSAQGRAVLLISSELAEILGLAHRVLVMNVGRIVADLDVKETDQEEILRYALGETVEAEPA
jgi:ribose transport system ATP-binding protein